VKLLSDCAGPNPRYDWSKPANMQSEKPERMVPAGTVIDHPRAYLFMRNGQAEPEDDEAKDWWEKFTGRQLQREHAVAAIRAEQERRAAELADDEDEDTEGDDDE